MLPDASGDQKETFLPGIARLESQTQDTFLRLSLEELTVAESPSANPTRPRCHLELQIHVHVLSGLALTALPLSRRERDQAGGSSQLFQSGSLERPNTISEACAMLAWWVELQNFKHRHTQRANMDLLMGQPGYCFGNPWSERKDINVITQSNKMIDMPVSSPWTAACLAEDSTWALHMPPAGSQLFQDVLGPTFCEPGWTAVMQTGSTNGLGRLADSSMMPCHCLGRPVNFCSCWS